MRLGIEHKRAFIKKRTRWHVCHIRFIFREFISSNVSLWTKEIFQLCKYPDIMFDSLIHHCGFPCSRTSLWLQWHCEYKSCNVMNTHYSHLSIDDELTKQAVVRFLTIQKSFSAFLFRRTWFQINLKFMVFFHWAPCFILQERTERLGANCNWSFQRPRTNGSSMVVWYISEDSLLSWNSRKAE